MRMLRRSVLGAALIALSLFASACGSGEDGNEPGGGTDEPKGSVTVGSDAFYEAQIVAAMYALVLEDAGYEVETQLDLRTREVRLPAMEKGEIDIAPEYLASLQSVVDEKTATSDEASTDPAEVAAQLEPVLAEDGLELLEHSDAVNVNTLVVTQDLADKEGLSTVSDLAPLAGDLVLGAPPECPDRPYCIPGFKETYGIEFADYRPLEYGQPTVVALEGGEIDVGLLFSTDPIISERGLVALEDDKDLQSADNITPLVRSEILTEEIESLLNEVSASLSTEKMPALNARVAINQEDPEDVARDYLEEEGLI